MTLLRGLRALLDGLYTAGGVLAALCMLGILVMIVLQMLARWTGEVFPGAPEYAGYCMAAASFLAFAHALTRGAHIRVGILVQALGPRALWLAEVWCFGVGAALAWYLTYYAARAASWSWRLNDISQGQDATPLWIPQLAMVAGAGLFALALTDNLAHLLVTGRHRIRAEAIQDRPDR
ncbi:TRAP transporter small permease [Roseospira visakhapatnamensis]|uniref:TRAP transporter small permease protein n=1 Tax=Roseospira visakhapatnamensis TaxID=390880 RepID=A0A7W6W8Z5_9PROT|nr:TRAP transporter small permease [Roseospira visakhapatnamensis]MBB4264936.1 TRAP-type C4-dicarboxylate transport system permease small subunit [Roseospira visakhapatnamensis]